MSAQRGRPRRGSVSVWALLAVIGPALGAGGCVYDHCQINSSGLSGCDAPSTPGGPYALYQHASVDNWGECQYIARYWYLSGTSPGGELQTSSGRPLPATLVQPDSVRLVPSQAGPVTVNVKFTVAEGAHKYTRTETCTITPQPGVAGDAAVDARPRDLGPRDARGQDLPADSARDLGCAPPLFDISGAFTELYNCAEGSKCVDYRTRTTILISPGPTAGAYTFRNKLNDWAGQGTLCGATFTWSASGTTFTETGTWLFSDAQTFTKTSHYVYKAGGRSGDCTGAASAGGTPAKPAPIGACP